MQEGKLGAHVSCTQDLPFNKLIDMCICWGWTCCQVFLGSPHECSNRRQLTLKETQLPKGFTVYTHFPYRMNLVKRRTKKDLEGLQYELDLMEQLGGYVVIHPNSPAVEGGPTNKQGRDGKNVDKYVSQYTKAIDTMINNIKLLENQQRLLLEPPAGEGQKIGWSFDQLRYICSKLDDEGLSVGFCIDTCHSFGAGLSRFKSASSTTTFIENLEIVGVLPRLRCIHLNDSKQPYASLKDSHELLGKGCIWGMKTEGLKALVNYCVDNNIDIICETGGQYDVDVVNELLER